MVVAEGRASQALATADLDPCHCEDERVPVRDLAARSHPRGSRPAVQLAVLAAAVLLGLLLGVVLLVADRSSWSGAQPTTATVTGVSSKGVLARAAGRDVVLHVAPVPRAGTTIPVEVSPDGRARPRSYAQTPLRATRTGVVLVVLLTLLLQAYRYVVTRRD